MLTRSLPLVVLVIVAQLVVASACIAVGIVIGAAFL